MKFEIGNVVMWEDGNKHYEGWVVCKHEDDMYTIEVIFQGDVVKNIIQKVSGDKLRNWENV